MVYQDRLFSIFLYWEECMWSQLEFAVLMNDVLQNKAYPGYITIYS